MPDNRRVAPPRFYAPAARTGGEAVELPPEEADHLARVLRLRTGAAIRVFDGHGREFEAVVDRIGKNGASVRVGRSCTTQAEARVAITLAHAVLKGDKMDAVVRDAVMMGAAAIQPLVSARTETAVATLHRGNRRRRWERIAIASAKQCGRAVVPAILEPRTFGDAVTNRASATPSDLGLMFVEPAATNRMLTLADLPSPAPDRATVLIGPEGGWTTDEIDLASHTCRFVTLGPRTLRADAMALVALSALFAHWREF